MNPQRKLLLVEGRDDREVVLQLGNVHAFNTQDAKVVIADADADPSARWTSIGDVLQRAGYAPPSDVPSRGWVGRAEGKPVVGVWIMGAPDGALEDHLVATLPADDSLLEHARRSVDTAPVDQRLFVPAHRAKAVAHCFLALCEPPGTPLGLALTRRLFDPRHPTNVALVEWLRQTFA